MTMEMVTEKLNLAKDWLADWLKNWWAGFTVQIDKTGDAYSQAKSIIGMVVMVLFRLRKVALAIPVVYYALKLAAYNMEHLPEMVGVNLQSNGAFADLITRNAAVMGPLAVTAGCLVLMFFSKKALYPWAISLFSLVLPLLIWFSNVYPM